MSVSGLKNSDHEKKLAGVFNILGMSSKTSAVDDTYQEDELTTRDTKLAAKRLIENDVFTKNGEDMLLNESNIDDAEQIDTDISEVGVEVEVDVDPEEALKSLSNLKNIE